MPPLSPVISDRRNVSSKTFRLTRSSWILPALCILSVFSLVSARSSFEIPIHVVGGSSVEFASMLDNVVSKGQDDTLVVFSDLDGTLIHYPDTFPKSQRNNAILKLPPSSTGMRGIISSKTLALIQEIRQKGAKFVLVSGMRTSTLLQRLPYLPRADAYCTEAGGRIFYPTDDLSKDDFVVKPQKYDGASPDDLVPFGLAEDMEWRNKMEEHAGKFGSLSLKELASDPAKLPKVKERDGLLWDFARDLLDKGYVLDTKGYSACFRVNKKQQKTVSDDEFQALSDGRIKPWGGLATSVNLSCVDFYPASSGKKNW
jgi:hypothetical protein